MTGVTGHIALIVSIDAREQIAKIAKIEDLADRIRRLDDVYRSAKKPVFEYLSLHTEIRLVNDLEGTPQLILSAPARAWRRLLSQTGSPFSAPNVDVTPNEVDWTEQRG